MGWTISGIPNIARIRGDAGITFTASDSYAYLPLGWGSSAGADNLLVATNADRYHLRRNIAGARFMEFQAAGTGCGSGPCYFIGRDGRGNTYYFGGDEQHTATGGSIGSALWEPDNGVTNARGIVAWSLYRVVDVYGNYYRIDYDNDGQTMYPKEIDYNLPTAGSGARSLAVEFFYAARGDTTPMPSHFTKRLYRINVLANCPGRAFNCSLLRRYELAYTTSLYAGNPSNLGNSLLTSITEYGSNSLAHGPPGDTSGGGLPPKTFTYTTSGGVAASTVDQGNAFDSLTTFRDDHKWQSLVGDIDGDGRADLVRVHLGTGGWEIQFTCGAKDNSGFTGPVQTLPGSSGSNQGEGLAMLADVNGDGKLDLVIAYPNAANHTISVYVALGDAGCSLGTWSDLLARATIPNFDKFHPFSSDISKWRLLAADIDGDGRTDIVLYDDGSNASSRRLYYMLSDSSGSSISFNQRIGSWDWQPFSNGSHTGSFPTDHTFNGIIVADLNGDGYSDVLACWSGAPYSTAQSHNEQSQLTVMTAYGSATGLSKPFEYSELSSVRWPFLALRSGDINGDGLPDILVNFQGRTDPADGVSNGRDLRNRLSGTVSGPNPFQVAGQDQYTYPYASLSDNNYPAHLNNWEFLSGDINGDGIDDFVEFYCGYFGRILDYGFGTPTGMALANGFYINGHPISDPTTGRYADSTAPLRKWLSALGDIDGDGKADFIVGQYGAGSSPSVQFLLGTTAGFSPDLNAIRNLSSSNASGDSRYLSMRIADINADGRADIILLDDNGDDPGSSRVTYALSPDSSSDAGIPDLLKTINNGMGGTTMLTYILARDYDAVRPDLPGPGHANARPRALVSAIMHDNGAGFADGKRYGYVNGRVLSGRPSQRADLGFERIREYSYVGTDMASLASLQKTLLPKKHDTFYHQDKPYQGLVSRIEDRTLDGTPLRIQTNTYVSTQPVATIDLYTVAPQTVQVDTYEQQGVLVHSGSVSTTWNLTNLTPTETVDHVIFPSGDNDIVTDVWYATDDANAWILGKPLGYAQYRLSSSAGSVSLLDKEQVSYDRRFPLSLASRQLLLLTSSELLCTRTPANPASLCNAEAAAGNGYWVTTFQNPTYDAYGNLSYAEGIYTGTPQQILTGNAFRHQSSLTYDANYEGLVATSTNALGHITRIGDDARFRFRSVTDPNGNTRSIEYDVYGRPETVTTSGTSSIVNTAWFYLGLTSNGYRTVRRRCSSRNVCHDVDIYLDGFGGVARTIDHSSAGDITRWVQKSFDQSTNQLVSRSTLPYLSGGTLKYFETRFDLRGRPVVRNRLDARTAVEKQLATYTYNQDGSVTATDANGHSTQTSFTPRGQVASSVDPMSNKTLYVYDNALKLVQVTLPAGQTGNVIAWGYDSWGRKTFESDPATGYTTYTYDPVSNLRQLALWDSGNRQMTSRIAYTYDALDRVVTEGDGNTPQVTYHYDERALTNPIGRLTSVTDPSGSTKLGYDTRGNLARREVTINGLSGSYVYTYGYNDQDQLTQKTFPTGSPDQAVQTVVYTNDGLPSDLLHNGQSYASYGRYNAFKQPGLRSSYAGVPTTSLGGVTPHANDTQYTYDMDLLLQELKITHTVGIGPPSVSSVVGFDEYYGYDPVGNLSSIIDRRSNKTVNGVNTDRTQSAAYDALDRLVTTCNNVSGCHHNCYDALGNIISDDGATLTYETSGMLKTIRATTSAGMPLWTAYADSEGKRTRFDDNSTTPVTTYRYTYDYQQRLSKVAANGLDIETYEYNFAGERTKSVVRLVDGSFTTTWFIGDAFQLQSNTADNAPSVARTWRVGDVAIITAGDIINGETTKQTVLANQYQSFAGDMQHGNAQGTWLMHQDRLGSVALATRPTDSSGRLDGTEVSRYWYTPWGLLQRGNSLGYDTTANKYTGKNFEEYSGLMFFNGRYYDPRSKRFITADDRIVPGGVQGYNRYAFILNNPFRFFDPTGHAPTVCANYNPMDESFVPCASGNADAGQGSDSGLLGKLEDLARSGQNVNFSSDPQQQGININDVGVTIPEGFGIPVYDPTDYWGGSSGTLQSGSSGDSCPGRCHDSGPLYQVGSSPVQEAYLVGGFAAAFAPIAVTGGSEAYGGINLALFEAYAAAPGLYLFLQSLGSGMVGGYQPQVSNYVGGLGCDKGLCVTNTLRAITGLAGGAQYSPSAGMNSAQAAAEAQVWLSTQLASQGYSLRQVPSMATDGSYVVILSGNRDELHMMFGQRANNAFNWYDMGKVIGNDNGMYLNSLRDFWGNVLRIHQVIKP
jgi:RHS repeat-associated protein